MLQIWIGTAHVKCAQLAYHNDVSDCVARTGRHYHPSTTGDDRHQVLFARIIICHTGTNAYKQDQTACVGGAAQVNKAAV